MEFNYFHEEKPFHEVSVTGIYYVPDANCIVTASKNRYLSYDANTGSLTDAYVPINLGGSISIGGIASNRILFTSNTPRHQIHNFKKETYYTAEFDNKSLVSSVASYDGKFAVAFEDGEIQLIDPISEKLVCSGRFNGKVNCIVESQGTLFVGMDGAIATLSYENNRFKFQKKVEIDKNIRKIAFVKNVLICITDNNKVLTFDEALNEMSFFEDLNVLSDKSSTIDIIDRFIVFKRGAILSIYIISEKPTLLYAIPFFMNTPTSFLYHECKFWIGDNEGVIHIISQIEIPETIH